MQRDGHRSRKAPTLIQHSKSGSWYARFRREGVSLPIGLRTPVRSKSLKPPTTSQDAWIQVGNYFYPRHVYDRFTADFVTPYLRGDFEPGHSSGDIRVAEAIEIFVSRTDLTVNTRESYRATFRLFLNSIPDRRMKVTELKKEDLLQFSNRVHLSAASRASYRRQINALINWCHQEKYLDNRDLVLPVSTIKSGRLGRKMFLSPGQYLEIRRLIEAASEKIPDYRKKRRFLSWTLDVYDLALSTGLRLEELVQLQWQDVKIERGVLEVRPKNQNDDGLNFIPKSKRARWVELQPLAIDVLQRPHISARSGSPHSRVLVGPLSTGGQQEEIRGERASKVWRKYRKLVPSCDPLPFHGLRHLYVTYCLILGYKPFLVQNWAGHSSFSTTEQYAQFASQLCSRKEREMLIQQIRQLGFAPP